MNRNRLLVLATILLCGCSSPKPEAPPPEVSVLQAGTAVPTVLMQQLESGGTPKDTEVHLMVSEDVKDLQGRVLIPKGAAAKGRVTWSRAEGSLGALTNTPA